MIELKYLTQYTARLKEDWIQKCVSYTRILDILFLELAPFLGSSSAKHQSYMYTILKEYLALEFKLLQIINAIQYFTSIRNKEDKEVARLISESDSPIFTIPEFGFKLGSVILAEIRDIKNFRSPFLCRFITFVLHF